MAEEKSGRDNEGEFEEIREQDRYLPIANIARIMKKVLPANAKIAKDAKECIQECVSEFISFITSEASDKCQQEKRKTINGDDIIFAMNTLGFDSYIDPLKAYLAKYRESVKGEKPDKPFRREGKEDEGYYESHSYAPMAAPSQHLGPMMTESVNTGMQQPPMPQPMYQTADNM